MIVQPKFKWSDEVDDYVYDSIDIKCSIEEILIINKALSIVANMMEQIHTIKQKLKN